MIWLGQMNLLSGKGSYALDAMSVGMYYSRSMCLL